MLSVVLRDVSVDMRSDDVAIIMTPYDGHMTLNFIGQNANVTIDMTDAQVNALLNCIGNNFFSISNPEETTEVTEDGYIQSKSN